MKNQPETNEEELILHYYGESADPRAIAAALAADPELAQRYEALARDLAAAATVPVPEAPVDLAARVWQQLRPRLVRQRSWRERLFGQTGRETGQNARWRPQWALAATLVVAAALAIGYLAGRSQAPTDTLAHRAAGDTSRTDPASGGSGLSDAARERLLLASVESHFSGSERLLTRLANAAPTDSEALADESAWAAALVSSNRLYRNAAERSGQRRIVALLDELEPLLVELSHSSDAAPDDLAAAQRRIEHTDLLFKLRVTGERLQRDAGASRVAPSTSTRTLS